MKKMKKMLFSLAIVLFALASCTPSPMDVKPGSAAEAAQKFFNAIKDKDFKAAAAVSDISDQESLIQVVGEEKVRGIQETALSTAFGSYGFKEVFPVSEEGEGDKVKVKMYGDTETEGAGYLTITCNKVGGKWWVDWSSVE